MDVNSLAKKLYMDTFSDPPAAIHLLQTFWDRIEVENKLMSFNYLDFHKAWRSYLSKIRDHTCQELRRLDEEDKKQLRTETEVFNHLPGVHEEGEEGMVDIAYTLLEIFRYLG